MSRPKLSIIVAMSRNGVIGRGNRMPWHLPADLKHFKDTTMGHAIIMGRKTFESIGRPLPGRRNIVITHRQDYQAPGCEVVHSLEQALGLLDDDEEAFIIGGATLYQQALPLADRLYITRIDAVVEGDIYFPNLDWTQWRLIDRRSHPADERNAFDLVFEVYERRRSPH